MIGWNLRGCQIYITVFMEKIHFLKNDYCLQFKIHFKANEPGGLLQKKNHGQVSDREMYALSAIKKQIV